MLGDQIIHVDPRTIMIRENRQRQRNITIDDLIPSIRARGIMHPLLVDDENYLVAGERRLRTAIHLQLATVPTRKLSTLSPTELKLFELEENLRRQDLAWQDKAVSFLQLHELYSGGKDDWTYAQTAGMISYNDSYTGRMIELGEAIRAGDQTISSADTYAAASTILVRRKDRAGAAALAGLLEIERVVAPTTPSESPPPPATVGGSNQSVEVRKEEPTPAPVVEPPFTILHEDFASWAAAYDGPRFNFLHCDFPYGVELNQLARQDRNEGEYDGGEEIYWALLDHLHGNLNRLILPSAHVMFWISMKHYTRTVEKLERIGFTINPTPLIWHKTDNKGIISDPLRDGRNTYEACLIGSLGDRKIVKPVAKSYGAPTGKADAIHTNEKPEPMLNHFFTMFVDEHTRLLDPTCGSGSSIRSAEALGAERALGLELNPEFAERAQLALVRARGMRQLSQRQGA